jgi:CubicO group peptidase (beta-lactamase class C family)
MFAQAFDTPLLFAPGSRYSYANTGFVLAAYLVEKFSGQALAAYFEQHIFRPVGLSATYYDPNDGQYAMHPGLAGEFRQYVAGWGGPTLSLGECGVHMSAGSFAGAAGVRATVADFHKWWRTVMRPDFKTPLVSETGLRALLKPRIRTGSAYYFAQGMQVIPSKQAGGFPTLLSYCGESYCTVTCNIMETSPDGADQVIVSSWTNHQIYVLPQATTFVELAGHNDYDVPLGPFADPALPWFSLAPPANGLGTFEQSLNISSNGASKLLAEYTASPTPKPTPAPPT